MSSYTPEEIALASYVNREINSGKRRIAIPKEMLFNVRRDIFEEILRLCKLNDVSVEVIE